MSRLLCGRARDGGQGAHTHTLWPPRPWELEHSEEVHGIPQHLPAAPCGFGYHRVRSPKGSPSLRCTSRPWLLEVEGHTWQRLSGAFCSLLVSFSLFRTQAGPVSHPARHQLVRAPIPPCSPAGAPSRPRTARTLPRVARPPLLPRRAAETPWTPRAEVMG